MYVYRIQPLLSGLFSCVWNAYAMASVVCASDNFFLHFWVNICTRACVCVCNIEISAHSQYIVLLQDLHELISLRIVDRFSLFLSFNIFFCFLPMGLLGARHARNLIQPPNKSCYTAWSWCKRYNARVRCFAHPIRIWAFSM